MTIFPVPGKSSAGGTPLDCGVVRLEPERDNVSGAGAERASESDSRHPANGAPYTTGPTLNDAQRDILRHALGMGRGSREYRNHFVTGKGSTDYPHCEALVAAGLMTRCKTPNVKVSR